MQNVAGILFASQFENGMLISFAAVYCIQQANAVVIAAMRLREFCKLFTRGPGHSPSYLGILCNPNHRRRAFTEIPRLGFQQNCNCMGRRVPAPPEPKTTGMIAPVTIAPTPIPASHSRLVKQKAHGSCSIVLVFNGQD